MRIALYYNGIFYLGLLQIFSMRKTHSTTTTEKKPDRFDIFIRICRHLIDRIGRNGHFVSESIFRLDQQNQLYSRFMMTARRKKISNTEQNTAMKVTTTTERKKTFQMNSIFKILKERQKCFLFETYTFGQRQRSGRVCVFIRLRQDK